MPTGVCGAEYLSWELTLLQGCSKLHPGSMFEPERRLDDLEGL